MASDLEKKVEEIPAEKNEKESAASLVSNVKELAIEAKEPAGDK